MAETQVSNIGANIAHTENEHTVIVSNEGANVAHTDDRRQVYVTMIGVNVAYRVPEFGPRIWMT